MAMTLGSGTIQELRETVRGEVIAPSDEGYDRGRAVWNGMIDRRPALIVRCAGVADVVGAVQFARSQDLEIAVRGGGHSLPGFSTSEGGIVIDLSGMRAVRVDAERMRAVAEGGATWADLDHETQSFGLAVTGGLMSTTGVAGFTSAAVSAG
jgi:FAD/FMN-containing dehydrogenase